MHRPRGSTRLYTGTVRRQDSQLRYTLKYSEELPRLSANYAGMHILLARSA